MNASETIAAAVEAAKKRAIIERVNAWMYKAETVEIVRETPTMERESSYVTARMIQTGELTIELRLIVHDDLKPRMADCMKDDRNSMNWHVTASPQEPTDAK